MQCPVCKETTLIKKSGENRPLGKTCSKCEGHWITYPDYQAWLKNQKHNKVESEADSVEAKISYESTKHALLCPDCGRILQKYRIAHDLDLILDHCGGCHGVWFDNNEWEAIKTKGIHKEVHLFFTDAWQTQMRDEISKKTMEAVYDEKFGPETHKELKRLKEWLDQQPQQSALIAYLKSDAPYEV